MYQRFLFYQPKNYRADIDGLRAIAILSVVLFHTYPEFIPGGFVGVDVFFVISGFLITKIIFKALEKESFSFRDFYARRIRRIFPAIIFLFFVIVLLGGLVLTPNEFSELGSQIVWGSGFAENVFLYMNTGGYWDTATEVKPMMHLWTLAVEEQYYLLYPLICWGVWKYKSNALLWLSVLWCLSFGSYCYLNFTNSTLAFFSLHARFWELCSGCILALVLNASPCSFFNGQDDFFSNQRLHNVFSSIGILIILGVIWIADGKADGPEKTIVTTLLSVLGAVLIVIADKSHINKKLLSSKPLVMIGLLSYTWYLWHWPFLAIARTINGGDLPSVGICTLLMLLGLICALISYFLVEAPVRIQPTSLRQVICLTSLLCICLASGALVKHMDGIPARLGDVQEISKLMVNKFPWKNKYCQDNFEISGNRCWSDENPNVAVIGDSHAWHLMYGLKKELSQDRFLLLGHSSTPPFFNAMNPKHEKMIENKKTIMTQGLETILNQESIEYVVLSAMWQDYERGYSVVDNDNLKKRRGEQSFFDDLLFVVQRLLQADKKVLILKDVPNMRFKPQNCIPSRPLLNKELDFCGISRADFEGDISRANRIIDQIHQKYPEVVVLDSSGAICDESRCYAIKNEYPLYRDENHLSELGSLLVVEELLKSKKELQQFFR